MALLSKAWHFYKDVLFFKSLGYPWGIAIHKAKLTLY
jgi:hypothetical protein